jgi:zinc transport system permease protein
MDIFELLQYSFIQKAFIAGSLIAITCSVLGIFLVLKKMSLIGDGLAHLSFGGIALGLFFGIFPTLIAIPVVLLGSLLIIKISKSAKVYGDSAIGIVSAVGISGGVILASLSKGFNIDLFSYLFGNILAISETEVILSIVLSLLVLVLIYIFYWDLFSSTFDEEFAKGSGIKTELTNIGLSLLTGITVVLSIKVVGVMLVSALLIIPAVTGLQLGKNFKASIIISAGLSFVSVILGILLSFKFDIPTGATIVMLNVVFFAISLFVRKLK